MWMFALMVILHKQSKVISETPKTHKMNIIKTFHHSLQAIKLTSLANHHYLQGFHMGFQLQFAMSVLETKG